MFIVSIFLVKIHLDVDQIAGYEYVLFLSSIVTGWWIHGFLQSFMADSGAAQDGTLQQVFKNYSRLLLWIGLGILIILVAAIEILSSQGILETPPAGFYSFLFFHFVLQVGILIAHYFHLSRWTIGIYALAGYVLFSYIGSFLLLLDEHTRLQTVYAWLAGLSLPLLILWIILYFRQPDRTTDLNPRRYIPHLTLLMTIQGIGFISLWSDGFWVQYFYGTEEFFALFRYGGREFPLFIILSTTFSTAIIHQANTNTGLQQIRNTSRRYIWIFSPIAAALIVCSPLLFRVVYSEKFVPASMIFDLYVVLILVRVLFPRPILIAHRYFRSLLWISLGELMVNVVLSYWLYWHLGLAGLILGTLIAHIFELTASIYIAYFKLNIHPTQYIPGRHYLFLVFGLISLLTIKYGLFPPEWINQLMGTE